MTVPDLEICLVHRAPFGDAFFANVVQRLQTGQPITPATQLVDPHVILSLPGLVRPLSRGWVRLPLPEAPFADGGFPTPSGKCEFFSSLLAAAGLDPLPAFIAPREWRQSPLADEFPLALITPPARNFLNTSFANSPRFLAQEKSPSVHINPADAASRGIADGSSVRIFNRRGEFHARAVVTDRVRPGVAMATSIWWRKLSPDGRNCNEVTSQALTDMAGGATFYDCLVEVATVEREAQPCLAAQNSAPGSGGSPVAGCTQQ